MMATDASNEILARVNFSRDATREEEDNVGKKGEICDKKRAQFLFLQWGVIWFSLKNQFWHKYFSQNWKRFSKWIKSIRKMSFMPLIIKQTAQKSNERHSLLTFSRRCLWTGGTTEFSKLCTQKYPFKFTSFFVCSPITKSRTMDFTAWWYRSMLYNHMTARLPVKDKFNTSDNVSR